MKKELITNNNPKSPVSEVFRSLRTNMQYMKKSTSKQTMVVTSTVQGEGKTWITTNLAVSFAQIGKKVLLVDADMRIPRDHIVFETEQYPGLSNYLSNVTQSGRFKEYSISDVAKETEVKNLSFIPAGNIPPNPSELLGSPRLKDLIEEAQEVFDVIIFDSSPSLLVTDSTIISRLVDSTIIVVSKGLTKMDDLKETKKRIEGVGGHIAGVVINRTKHSSKKYESRYYYSKDTAYEKATQNAKSEQDDEEIKSTKNFIEETIIKEDTSYERKSEPRPRTYTDDLNSNDSTTLMKNKVLRNILSEEQLMEDTPIVRKEVREEPKVEEKVEEKKEEEPIHVPTEEELLHNIRKDSDDEPDTIEEEQPVKRGRGRPRKVIDYDALELERVRAEAEKEKKRLEREAEKERKLKEKEAEKERIRKEKEAEKERIRKEKEAEKERIRKEKEAEEERIRKAAEKAEKERLAKEAEKELKRKEKERQKAEAERLAKQKAKEEAAKKKETKKVTVEKEPEKEKKPVRKLQPTAQKVKEAKAAARREAKEILEEVKKEEKAKKKTAAKKIKTEPVSKTEPQVKRTPKRMKEEPENKKTNKLGKKIMDLFFDTVPEDDPTPKSRKKK